MPNIDSIMHSRIFDPTVKSGILRLTRATFSIDKFQKWKEKDDKIQY